jgi:hypothetical protein
MKPLPAGDGRQKMNFASWRERLVTGVMVDLAVDCDGDFFELLGERREARSERENQLIDARRVDDELIDSAGVFFPATWKVDGRHTLNLASRVLA